jgi:hypothetical protein
MTRRFLLILAVVLSLTLTTSTQAQTSAFFFDDPLIVCPGDPNDTVCHANSVRGTDGFKFRPSADIQITDLGYYDRDQDGVMLVHPVGIFDFDTRDELARVDIDATSFLDGLFRYSPIAPLTLTAGRSYLVAGFHPGSTTEDFAANTPANLMTAAEIDLQEYFFDETSDLRFPTESYDPFRFFGPNFRYLLEIDTAPIDFDADGQLNCNDIDVLVGAVANNTPDAKFDLNNDFQLDRFDVESWLTRAGLANNGVAYEFGDANLDAAVNGADLDIWNANHFGDGAWCAGDFTADGKVDGSDFNVWNVNAAAAAASSVPEPAAWSLLLLGCCAGRVWNRRNR